MDRLTPTWPRKSAPRSAPPVATWIASSNAWTGGIVGEVNRPRFGNDVAGRWGWPAAAAGAWRTSRIGLAMTGGPRSRGPGRPPSEAQAATVPPDRGRLEPSPRPGRPQPLHCPPHPLRMERSESFLW